MSKVKETTTDKCYLTKQKKMEKEKQWEKSSIKLSKQRTRTRTTDNNIKWIEKKVDIIRLARK